MRPSYHLVISTFSWTVLSKAFLSPPQGLTEVLSDKFPGASITYKKVNGVCETSEGVSSYSGYVNLPKEFIPDAVSWPDDMVGHLFFWYFEARNKAESAPTAIYMGGGPGYTTFDSSDVFPCYFNSDSNSTTLNEHSWNQDANVLYVDQPLGTGFSYTNLANGTYNFLTKTFDELDGQKELPTLNSTLSQATLQTQLHTTMTNTTMSCARTLWRFAQVFFNDFPEWDTKNDKITVWSVSYGGLYGSIFASYAIDQNAIIKNGSHELPNATTLNIGTVGLMNAILDVRAMFRGVPEFFQNNTYGIDLVSDELIPEIVSQEESCFDAIDTCREAVANYDPESFGKNQSVNNICIQAIAPCLGPVVEFESKGSLWNFDISKNRYARSPSEYNTAFFNQPWVQAELGVPLNYTREPSRNMIQSAFFAGDEDLGLSGTGDPVRYNTSVLSHLIDNGINVALVYGDLDLQCNWFSGEDSSLQIDYADKTSFASAGYAPVVTNSSYEGGLVRESGLLSFSRVFQAGHSTGGYQPETVSAIFKRAVFGYDIATGEIELANNRSYSTDGPLGIRDVKSDAPDPVENVCYLYDAEKTCTPDQFSALQNGTANIEGWVVINPKGVKELSSQGESGGAGGPGNETEQGDEGGSSVETGGSSPKLVLTMSWATAMAVLAIMFS